MARLFMECDYDFIDLICQLINQKSSNIVPHSPQMKNSLITLCDEGIFYWRREGIRTGKGSGKLMFFSW